jgi:hypothetical protein
MSSNRIRITYYVADGYVGKDRPHSVYAEPDDFDGCETDEEFDERIWEIVDDHFRANISPEFDDEDGELISRIRSAITAVEAE